MAISVAPLTTAVVNSVDVAQAGIASGINNAISRLAGLLSVAVFGVVLLAAFQSNLSPRLKHLALPSAQLQAVEAQRSQLAAVQTKDPRIQHAVAEAFVFGFRRILWLAVGLCLASSVSAQMLSNKPGSTGQEADAEPTQREPAVAK